ncbi:MAG: hypothetical protein ACNA7V_01305 [Bacteroidales bacterium]
MEIHAREIKPVFEAFSHGIVNKFVQILETKAEERSQFISTFREYYKKLALTESENQSLPDLVRKNQSFKHNLLTLILHHRQNLMEGDLKDAFRDFITAAGQEIDKLEHVISREEVYRKYSRQKGDNLLMMVQKALINAKLQTKYLVRSVSNIGRQLLRMKKLSSLIMRKRHIPFQRMARHFLIDDFSEKALVQLTQSLQWESKNLLQLWLLDDEMDKAFQQFLSSDHQPHQIEETNHQTSHLLFDRLLAENDEFINKLRTEISQVTHMVFKSFDDAFGMADTTELPASKFNLQKLAKNQNRINNIYKREIGRWKNAHLTLLDDWAVDVEITNLYYAVFDQYNHLRSNIDKFISLDLGKRFMKVSSFINASVDRIKNSSGSTAGIKEIISAERIAINKQLIDKILTQIAESLTDCFSQDFINFTSGTSGLVNKVSDKRGFIKSKDYERPVRDSEINYISPRELLNFEALPNFRNKVASIQEMIEASLEKARFTLLSLGTVSDFNLESSLLLLEKETDAEKQALEVAIQGYDRALTQLEAVKEITGEIQTSITRDLRNAVHVFNSDVQRLKNTENIFDLNLKIARIKTMEQSRLYRKQMTHYLRNLVPETINLIARAKSKLRFRMKEIRNRIGLPAEKPVATYELSEFMGETGIALKKLPFVYQRLYQLQPTDEERFFVNREKELGLLLKAYENWTKDRFVTIAVIGEKGSGTTSLINYFLRQINSDMPVYRHTLNQKVYTGEQYFILLNALFETEGLSSNQELIDHLNGAQGTRIVVLENLQHLFLKKVNGFDCMKMLFELMTHTQKKALWIGVYTPTSWEYLDKTISVSNYFIDEIRMELLNNEIIQEIVFKRNRLSGYQIIFTPSEINLQSKLFQKLDEENKQLFLRKQFFMNLYRRSNGNISLAQMYWLHSTQSVDEKYIRIAIIGSFDLAFVKTLSGNFLFALQVLLLHDGLTLEDFSIVMNQPENVSRNLLIPMLEKGLLIRPVKKFNINPIIYKDVLAYLASRNFIH